MSDASGFITKDQVIKNLVAIGSRIGYLYGIHQRDHQTLSLLDLRLLIVGRGMNVGATPARIISFLEKNI